MGATGVRAGRKAEALNSSRRTGLNILAGVLSLLSSPGLQPTIAFQ